MGSSLGAVDCYGCFAAEGFVNFMLVVSCFFNKVGLSGPAVCRVNIMGTCDTMRIYDKTKNLLVFL